MVVFAELLLGIGILVVVYGVAVGRSAAMTVVEPDVEPGRQRRGPVTGRELAGLHLPLGVGYRKVDVDRLIERLRAQLPAPDEEAYAWAGHTGAPLPEGALPGARDEAATIPHEPVAAEDGTSTKDATGGEPGTGGESETAGGSRTDGGFRTDGASEGRSDA